jgi:NADH pyrophosphatase NudC (nudix superfamily)
VYPRIDPAVIVLVTRGEHVLLGRNAKWPEGRHSAFAGFAEVGETLEQAAAREVREEAGIEVRMPQGHGILVLSPEPRLCAHTCLLPACMA